MFSTSPQFYCKNPVFITGKENEKNWLLKRALIIFGLHLETE
jgi:hypothetical protein